MDTITAKSANGASDPGLVSALAEDVALAPPTADEAASEAPLLAAAAGAAGPEVKLNFVNRSNDAGNVHVLVFGQPPSPELDGIGQAWRVIDNCGPGWSHPFTWPVAVTLGVVDPNGNVSPQLDIADGQVAEVVAAPSGTLLRIAGQQGPSRAIALMNQLPQGFVAATVFRDGQPYARTSLAPHTTVTLAFKPTIWIGAAARTEASGGEAVSTLTEISLMGVASADIVMTGGGQGADARPFVFTLANVAYA
ncbi:hypothetical protein SGCZBJ_15215 [Caulobacter zeae]|uniref:Aromatic ring-opening dioxygenase LigA n=1 Tax=Caulobacter zeae TaxID=2055137 RepID=A0A2N5DCY4_9CAUL|nr:hypothetical protein [Caulobacter zeae]PLR23924.1 hypothetical protein SGCZBJ_15215 [Caulobacter zeae]